MDDDVMMDTHPKYQMTPHDANKVTSILGDVSPLCNSKAMYQLPKERGGISQISCALGSAMVAQEISSIHSIDDAMIDQLFNE
eukprot:9265034-Ditylum_brightwellii.AAC.1